MKNRAKCKICLTIIESFHSTDYVECGCGEIAVDAGPAMRCLAKDFKNFIRIDDEGNEVMVLVKDGPDLKKPNDNEAPKPTRLEMLNMLDNMIKTVEKLPQHAMSGPINHYDYLSLMLLLSSILRAERSS